MAGAVIRCGGGRAKGTSGLTATSLDIDKLFTIEHLQITIVFIFLRLQFGVRKWWVLPARGAGELGGGY